ncbi:hypothetical protein DICVIV_10801 [Dictyocaulus viviparus]|uniref:Major facilitator superfamily (MFS) profile domain-containing protein n=1 Tax=Dictyocaulus viviparus TaxID=29172 RepID=A0A0D8XHJ2_DICVI|nr:hypothetical protein DICVIV_10801 [Dictyocaulus viviparus]
MSTYQQVCISLSNQTGISDCQNAFSSAAKNVYIQTEANRIALFASICLCVTAMMTSPLIGSIGDRRSRRFSMLVPFIGIIFADVTLLLQAVFFQSSPYWFPFSELIFGCFGGYMTILSTLFAYITSVPGVEAHERSKNVSRLEGMLGIGGIIGFLIASQLSKINYVNMFLVFIAVHIFCFCYITQMKDHALFVYPLCKSLGIRDVVLVIIGLITRGLGRVWFALVWNSSSVFGAILFEMFARFPAAGLRSLISNNVEIYQRDIVCNLGGAFAVVAVLEGGCKIVAVVAFHLLFPWSIPFMPQLSFIIMAVLIIPPTILIW